MFAFGEVMNMFKSNESELSNFLKESLYVLCTTDSIDELNNAYSTWINDICYLIRTNPIGDVATANDVFMKTYLSNRERLDPDDRYYELMNMLFDAIPSQYYK